MDDFLDTVIAEGKAEGKTEGKAELIQQILKSGNMTIEQIAGMVKLPVEKVKELAEMDLASA